MWSCVPRPFARKEREPKNGCCRSANQNAGETRQTMGGGLLRFVMFLLVMMALVGFPRVHPHQFDGFDVEDGVIGGYDAVPWLDYEHIPRFESQVHLMSTSVQARSLETMETRGQSTAESTTGHRLIAERMSATDAIVKWPYFIKRNFTWCIDEDSLLVSRTNGINIRELEEKSARMLRSAAEWAFQQWSLACDVSFHYVPRCSHAWGIIRLDNLNGEYASAPIMSLLKTFGTKLVPDNKGTPWLIRENSGKKVRLFSKSSTAASIVIGRDVIESSKPFAFLAGLLMHEIGHLLGFRHEHILLDHEDCMSEDESKIVVLNPELENDDSENLPEDEDYLETVDSGEVDDSQVGAEEDDADHHHHSDGGGRDNASRGKYVVDRDSVMAYDFCGGHRSIANITSLSTLDVQGAKAVYGAPPRRPAATFSEFYVGEAVRRDFMQPFVINETLGSFLAIDVSLLVTKAPSVKETSRIDSRFRIWHCLVDSNGDFCAFFGSIPKPHVDPFAPMVRTLGRRPTSFECPIPRYLATSFAEIPRFTLPREPVLQVCDVKPEEIPDDCGSQELIFEAMEKSMWRVYHSLHVVGCGGNFSIIVDKHHPRQAAWKVEVGKEWTSAFSFVSELPKLSSEPSSGERTPHGQASVLVGFRPSREESKFNANIATTTFKMTVSSLRALPVEEDNWLNATAFSRSKSTDVDWSSRQLTDEELSKVMNAKSTQPNVRPITSIVAAYNTLESFPPEDFRPASNSSQGNDQENVYSQVKKLDVSENKLSILRESLITFSSLEILLLVGNQLEEIPAWISNLKSLVVVDATRNSISKVDGLSSVPRLKQLDLSYNKLRGRPTFGIAVSPSKAEDGRYESPFQSLERLDLGFNQIENLDAICKMTKLTGITLTSNRLQEIPDCVIGMQTLRSLILNDNALRSLPNKLSTNLVTFNAANNNITVVPDSLGPSMTSARVIVLSRNDISQLPESLLECKKLKALEISFNKIKQLPDAITSLKYLRSLDVRANLLSSLPKDIGESPQLGNIQLSDNVLESIPPSFSNLRLTHLRLDGNRLEGLPQIAPLTRLAKTLENLSARENYITSLSSLHSSWFHLLNLRSLDVARNNITDISALRGVSGMEVLDLSRNNISTIHEEICSLQNIRSISMSRNRLTETPDCDFKNLTRLKLDFNHIRSSPHFGSIKSLRTLDLRGHEISSIPFRGFESSSLRSLDLSYSRSPRVTQVSVTKILIAFPNLLVLNLCCSLMKNAVLDFLPLSLRRAKVNTFMESPVLLSTEREFGGKLIRDAKHVNRVKDMTSEVTQDAMDQVIAAGGAPIWNILKELPYKNTTEDMTEFDYRETKAMEEVQEGYYVPFFNHSATKTQWQTMRSVAEYAHTMFKKKTGHQFVPHPSLTSTNGARNVFFERNRRGVGTMVLEAGLHPLRKFSLAMNKLNLGKHMADPLGDETTKAVVALVKLLESLTKFGGEISGLHPPLNKIVEGDDLNRLRGPSSSRQNVVHLSQSMTDTRLEWIVNKNPQLKKLEAASLGRTLPMTAKLPNLKILIWEMGSLRFLPAWVFNLKELRVLRLMSNEIMELPEEKAPEGLQNLKELYLSYNFLTSVPSWLLNLPELKFVDMSFNLIGELPDANPVALNKLILGNNDLQRIPESYLTPNLEDLHLEDNMLSELPDTLCETVMETLLLTSNHFESLDVSCLPQLETVDLRWNPLKRLVASENNTVLRQIELSHTLVTAESISTIWKGKRNSVHLDSTNFEKLSPEMIESLQGCFILDISLTPVKDVPQMPGCSYFYAQHSQISNFGPRIPARLTRMFLRGNQLRHLTPAQLVGLLNIGWLKIDGNPLVTGYDGIDEVLRNSTAREILCKPRTDKTCTRALQDAVTVTRFFALKNFHSVFNIYIVAGDESTESGKSPKLPHVHVMWTHFCDKIGSAMTITPVLHGKRYEPLKYGDWYEYDDERWHKIRDFLNLLHFPLHKIQNGTRENVLGVEAVVLPALITAGVVDSSNVCGGSDNVTDYKQVGKAWFDPASFPLKILRLVVDSVDEIPGFGNEKREPTDRSSRANVVLEFELWHGMCNPTTKYESVWLWNQ